jgi:hypothetical protein
MFTSSTKEDYERTLKNFIYSTKGITQFWIRPSLLNKMKNCLITNHEARPYNDNLNLEIKQEEVIFSNDVFIPPPDMVINYSHQNKNGMPSYPTKPRK